LGCDIKVFACIDASKKTQHSWMMAQMAFDLGEYGGKTSRCEEQK